MAVITAAKNLTRQWRTFSTAFSLGWQNESNWTWRPVYLLYAAIRPLALCLILYFLFMIAAKNPSTNQTFISVFLGNAFFTVFMTVSGGIGWVIIEDREFFRIIKYVYIAPSNFVVYILGRSTILVMVALFSLSFVLVFGLVVLELPINAAQIHWPMLIASFFLGSISTLAIGMIFAAFIMVTAKHAFLLAEGVGGAFLLLCGVIYPISFLPMGLRAFAYAMPMTYWMEATRRAFSQPPFGTTFAGWSDSMIMIVLVLTVGVSVMVSRVLFARILDYAKKTGKIDQVTHY